MKGKTTTLKIKNLVLTLILFCISSFANAQLVTGDIAFVGINSDANPNELAILTLSPIASGQTILITDYAWNGTSLETTNSIAEGAITWVTNTIVPKGTLIKITIGVGATIGGGLSAFGSVTATGWSGDAIASGGDNWFVLQGSIAAPNFIYAYANWSSATYGIKTWPSSGVTFPNATISYLPSSLSNGTTANIQSGSSLYHFDNNVYTGIKAGTKSDILAAIANSTSWSGSEVDTEIKDLSPGGTNFPGTNPIFTVGPPASVSTHPSSTSVCSNTNASFSIVASNATGYQWQVDQGQGAGFVNVSNTAPYSGATTATLTITNVTNAMNGYVYKCIAKGVADATSSSATLTVKQTTVVTDTQVACDTYTWINGVTYTANNNSATFTRTNAAGCNEVVTLNLTIKKSTAVTDTQVACDTYTWINGVTYTASNNTATFSRTNAAGCNEVVTLNLTIKKSTAVTDTQVACDTYTWINGVTYTASNNAATFTRTNAAGCNEVVTLNLTIKKSTAVTDTQVACDTYTWINGVTYTASNNTATFTRTNAAGCNEVVTLNLTIKKSTAVTDTQVACDTYTWINGVTYTASNNTATFSRTNAAGCNEVVTLNLTIKKSTAVTDTQVACDTYTWINGVTYTASNNSATFSRTNAAGCNEVVTLNLTIKKSTAVTDTQVACDTYTWINGVTYTASNNSATFSRTNAAGCNEVVTLNLTIKKSTTVTDTQVACDTYTWINGVTYTASNNSATFSRTNAAGCNEVVTLNLTIKKSTAVTDTQVACDTYTWINGVTYTASNNSATFSRTNAAGCNEVVTLNLTIKKSTAVTDTQVACDTYTWINGVTYTASNNSATFSRTNAAGCNEVVTLNLTIKKSTAVTDTQVACDTYTWINGVTYTASNNTATFSRTNAAGCNEVVTLNLTIKKSTAVTDTQVVCDTYTWINGITYTASNNSATFSRTNAAGCNEVVTLNLTIKKSTAVTDTQVACDTYTWINGITYTASNNTATFTRTNAAGCNEVVMLNLTINKTNPPTGTYSQGAILSGTLVDLVAIGNNIQWYDSPSGGMPLPLSTVLISGKKYYASQNNNSCESSTRLEVEVECYIKKSRIRKRYFLFLSKSSNRFVFLKI